MAEHVSSDHSGCRLSGHQCFGEAIGTKANHAFGKMELGTIEGTVITETWSYNGDCVLMPSTTRLLSSHLQSSACAGEWRAGGTHSRASARARAQR